MFLAFVALISSSNPQAPDEGAAEPKAEEKKICKKVETTGRRTGAERVCMTKSEWDKVEGRRSSQQSPDKAS